MKLGKKIKKQFQEISQSWQIASYMSRHALVSFLTERAISDFPGHGSGTHAILEAYKSLIGHCDFYVFV